MSVDSTYFHIGLTAWLVCCHGVMYDGHLQFDCHIHCKCTPPQVFHTIAQSQANMVHAKKCSKYGLTFLLEKIQKGFPMLNKHINVLQ